MGKYVIIDTLGEGSFAITKAAIDSETGQKVALKIFKTDISQSSLEYIVSEI